MRERIYTDIHLKCTCSSRNSRKQCAGCSGIAVWYRVRYTRYRYDTVESRVTRRRRCHAGHHQLENARTHARMHAKGGPKHTEDDHQIHRHACTTRIGALHDDRFGHRLLKIRHSQLSMTNEKSVMYLTSYICYTELSRHRFVFISVMDYIP
jgi:hypothetical protein